MLRFFIEKIKLGCKRKKEATVDVEDDIKTAVEQDETVIGVNMAEESIIDVNSSNDEIVKERETEETTLESTKQSESFDRPGIFPWLNLPYVPRRRILDFCTPAYWHVFGQLSDADNLMVETMAKRPGFDLTQIEFRLVNCTKTHRLGGENYTDGNIVLESRDYFVNDYKIRTQPTFTIEDAAEFIKYWMKLKKAKVLYFYANILNKDLLRMFKLISPQTLGAFEESFQPNLKHNRENILDLIEFNFEALVRLSCIDELFVIALIQNWEEGAYPKLERTTLAVDETLLENLDELKRLYPWYVMHNLHKEILTLDVFSLVDSNLKATLLIDKDYVFFEPYRVEIV